MKKFYLLFSLFFLVVVSCDSVSTPTELEWETKTIDKTVGDCKEDTSGSCAKVFLQYPEFKENAISSILNDSIKAMMNGFDSTGKKFADTDLFIQTFFENWKTANEDEASLFDAVWYHDSRLAVFSQNEKVICLVDSFSTYTGGAHGYYSVIFKSFSKNTGKCLTLEDIIKEGKRKDLLALAEKKLRNQLGITDNQSWIDGGLLDNSFDLNQNFALRKDGISFVYNPYEITPYAMGIVQIDLPLNELKEILKSEELF